MKRRVVLIGGFNKTRTLAVSLIKKGYKVTAINSDMDKCAELAKVNELDVFNGDGSKPFILEDANVYNANIAIALTDRDDDNLVICELCKKKFKVKKTVALITDQRKTEFFYRMGIDDVVCAITTLASVIEQHAIMDEMSTLIAVGGSQLKIAQVRIGSAAPAVNKKIWELNLPNEVIIGFISRGDKNIVPRGETRIMSGDILILISTSRHENQAIKQLTGNVGATASVDMPLNILEREMAGQVKT
ncbi:MAG: TrkA family potassium uptake protein [Clostridiales bacterium]|jgi:trk system potassium uptake protein TrkA|nr:TrkA family potassium uptake protein [Clostridiales bacterium]